MIFGRKTKRKVRIRDQKLLSVKKKRIYFHRDSSRSVFSSFFYWLSLLIFCGVVIYVFFFSPLITIKQFDVTGAVITNKSVIEQIIHRRIQGKYLNLLPKNNIVLISKNSLRSDILSRYKLINKVEIKKKFPDRLFIRVSERRLGMILCGSGKCFVLNDAGQAFAEADFSSNEMMENQLLILRDNGNREINSGEILLEPAYMDYLSTVREKMLSEIGLEFEREMETPQLASEDIRLKSRDGWTLFINREIPVEKEVEMLKIVIKEKIEKGRIKDLEYIDLRTDNKVYYKFK